MIEKILDKYYCRKVLDSIDIIFILRGLEHKYKLNKDGIVHIFIKKIRYKDNLYREIYAFNIRRSLDILIYYEQFRKEIKKRIEVYINENN